MKAKEFFIFAINNLKARKIRSWLTIVGVVIGIAAIVGLLLLGQGLQNAVTEQFKKAGVDKIIVFAGKDVGAFYSMMVSEKFNDYDVRAIEKVAGVEKATGMIAKVEKIEFGKESAYTVVIGMDKDMSVEDFSGISVEEGLGNVKSDDEMIIGYLVRHKDLFDKEVRIGDKLKIRGEEFKVVGSLNRIGNSQDDKQIYITTDAAKKIFNEYDYSIILVKVKKGFDVDDVAEEIKEKLRKHRGLKKGEEDFSIRTMGQMMETFQNVFMIIQIIVAGIAAISLVVGGVGIMNTMYTSVLERTKIIGTMKAVGAKEKHVLALFLIESALIGLVGGIIGVLLGIFFSKLVEYIAIGLGFYLIKIVIDAKIIALALAFSFVIGIISGFMPSRHAAKLDAIEALRYE
jgi:putative ABC transport system permease protein